MFTRLFWFLLGGLAVAIGLFFLGGKMADPAYTGSRSILVDAPVKNVWTLLSDSNSTKISSLESLQHIKVNQFALNMLRQRIPFSSALAVEIVDQSPSEFIVFNLKENKFGITGTWRYEFEPEGDKTKVTVIENSVAESLFTRSLLNVTGRDVNMEMHLKAIKKGAENLPL